jgi:hypothetical protein
MWFESVAQLVEHRPFKALVLGSSPSALTISYQQLIGNQKYPKSSEGYKRDTWIPAETIICMTMADLHD